MEKILQDYLHNLITKAQDNGLVIRDQREVNYGHQLLFSQGEHDIPVNIYYSKKKGISVVIGGSPVSPLKPVLQKIIDLPIDEPVNDHNWDIWLGSDESGKGDFFGPLVVCGFLCKKAMIKSLQNMGVKDSKLLKDKDVRVIAEELLQKFSPFIRCIVLKPMKYNTIYQSLAVNGKNLNNLLAWMHSRIILDMHKKHEFQGAVIDRFASNKVLHYSLKGLDNISILNKYKGEIDLAVASASIIARDRFLKEMENMKKKYQIDFPKGSYHGIVQAGKLFVEKYGKERLNEVAKTHFKTFREI